MATITINITDAQLQKLQSLAQKMGISEVKNLLTQTNSVAKSLPSTGSYSSSSNHNLAAS
jgi:hypothetical protein